MDEVDYSMAVRFAWVLIAVCILAGHAAGLGLDVNILERVQGHADWFSLSNGPVQRFTLRWENTGSVNCLTRARIDFHVIGENGSLGSRVCTSWGSLEPLMAGQARTWELYSALPGGGYAAVLRVYYCNELFEQEPYFFNVTGSEPSEGLSIDRVEVHGDYVDVFVRSPDGAGGVVVIPEEYPGGWIFQPGYAGDIGPGETAGARLGFVPVMLEGAAVKIRALSGDGGLYGEREFSLSVPQEPSPDWGTIMLVSIPMAVILAVILYVSRFIIKIWRR
jgi:hypothetical protein